MGKKSLTICAIILFAAVSASAQITVYDQDRPGWESAVGVYEEEFFDDATLNPGVVVASDYPGYVNTTKGVWWDRLNCPGSGVTKTTWMFSKPIRAFGADWNPGIPGGPGAGIEVAINGSWVYVGEIPETYVDKFWGFVSAIPFNAVRLMHGSNCSGAWTETYEMDNMVYSYLDAIDIKPGSCPNPINTNSKGVLPVAVLGTEDFDVTDIDPTTIQLFREGFDGVSPLRGDYEDVATPFVGELCNCHDLDGDGYIDLTLKFNTQELVETLGLGVEVGNTITLILNGNLKEEFGGRQILGIDCVIILSSKK